MRHYVAIKIMFSRMFNGIAKYHSIVLSKHLEYTIVHSFTYTWKKD